MRHLVATSATIMCAVPVALFAAPPSAIPDGDLCVYAANQGSDYVSVVDAASNIPAAEIHVQGSPVAVAVDPAGQFVYVIRTGGEVTWLSGQESTGAYLSVIDTSAYASVREIPVSEGSDSILVSPDGRVAYVGNDVEGTVLVVDVAAGSVSTSIFTHLGSGGYGVPIRPALSADGSRLYAPMPDAAIGSIAVIDTKTRTVASTLAFWPDVELPEPLAVALAPDGHTAYVLLGEANTIPILDVTTGAVIRAIGAHGSAIALSLDGSQLYVAEDAGTLDIVDTVTNAVSSVALGPFPGAAAIVVSPGTDSVYVAERNANAVAVVDMTTHAVEAQVLVGNAPVDLAVGRISGACRPAAYTPLPTETPTPTPTTTPTRGPTAQCPAGVPCLEVSSASGQAGSNVTVRVSLHTAGVSIAGVQNRILFDPRTALRDCVAAPGFGPLGVGFGYTASAVSAVVLTTDLQPIAEGALLYSCTAAIAGATPAGAYPFLTDAVVGSDPSGNPVGVTGADGEIVVDGQPIVAAAQGIGGSSAGSGCQMASDVRWSSLVPLMLPPVLLWRRRTCLP